MSDTPNNFEITWSGKTAHVKRHFDFAGLGTVSIDFKIDMGPGRESTIDDIHRASVSIAVRQLLTLLPEGFGGGAFVPGPAKKST